PDEGQLDRGRHVGDPPQRPRRPGARSPGGAPDRQVHPVGEGTTNMSIQFDFTDRSIVVSGAAQGLGAAIVRRFAAAGGDVLALDRDADALEAAWGASDGV